MSQQISSTMKTTDTVGVVQPEQLREIYDHFTESVRDLGNKAKGHAGSKKLGNSFMHWIGGGHIRTDRDRLCEEFLEQVQGFLGEFDTGLQGLAPEEAAALCGQVADIMLAQVQRHHRFDEAGDALPVQALFEVSDPGAAPDRQ